MSGEILFHLFSQNTLTNKCFARITIIKMNWFWTCITVTYCTVSTFFFNRSFTIINIDVIVTGIRIEFPNSILLSNNGWYPFFPSFFSLSITTSLRKTEFLFLVIGLFTSKKDEPLATTYADHFYVFIFMHIVFIHYYSSSSC